MALYGLPAAGGNGEMAGYAPAKMKRKDPEELYDEFSEFSLSSPARKIRRLDVELIPITEEGEEPAVPHVFGQPLREEQLQSSSQKMAGGLAEVQPPLTSNEERAIVLYKPVYAPFLDFSSSSDVLLRVDPDVIAGFKNGGFWSGRCSMVEATEVEGEASTEGRQAASSSCLAVVPWVPSQPFGAAFPSGAPGGMSEVANEAAVSEDVEATSMDAEEEEGRPSGAPAPGMVMTEGFQHWQQHCMTPQISPSNATPITWSWG